MHAQSANNFLAIHRASLARCGPSTSDPATAPSNSTTSNEEIFPDKMSQGTGAAFFADPKGLERQVAGVPAAA
jgi:hypothetical protein